jgi:hypothetical protein
MMHGQKSIKLVYFMFYWYSLRQPDNDCKYDRNTLVISNM